MARGLYIVVGRMMKVSWEEPITNKWAENDLAVLILKKGRTKTGKFGVVNQNNELKETVESVDDYLFLSLYEWPSSCYK